MTFSKATLNGINVQSPWAKLILEGIKKIETRNYGCPKAYIDQPVILIETPGDKSQFKARGIGIIKFTESFKYENLNHYMKDFEQHRVSTQNKFFWVDENIPKYGWRIEIVEVLSTPFKVPSRRGYVWSGKIQIPY